MQSVCIWVFLNMLNDTRNFLFLTKGLCLFNLKKKEFKKKYNCPWHLRCNKKKENVFSPVLILHCVGHVIIFSIYKGNVSRVHPVCILGCEWESGTWTSEKSCLLKVYIDTCPCIYKEKFTYNTSGQTWWNIIFFTFVIGYPILTQYTWGVAQLINIRMQCSTGERRSSPG